MRRSGCTLKQVIDVQCKKPPVIVAETTDVLNTLDCIEEATMLSQYSYLLKHIYIHLSALHTVYRIVPNFWQNKTQIKVRNIWVATGSATKH